MGTYNSPMDPMGKIPSLTLTVYFSNWLTPSSSDQPPKRLRIPGVYVYFVVLFGGVGGFKHLGNL